MRRLLKIAKGQNKQVESTLRASAALPTSGFTFVDNSQGASAAVAELSDALGAVIEGIDVDGDLNAQAKLLTSRLDEEVSKYHNSQVVDNPHEKWSCSKEQARLISIAWKCADGAYNASPRSPEIAEGYTLTQDHTITPSLDGTIKAVTFTKVTPAEAQEGKHLLPVLIVAIRGSASTVDHMVNANSIPRSVGQFIDVTGFGIDEQLQETGLQAHSGFLQSAMALDSFVSKRITEYTKSCPGNSHILFTGHSAGGGVASLLFLRHLSRTDLESTKFSCITFGAPPTVTLPLAIDAKHLNLPTNLCLNIINEFDLVTRADKPYILCLVNLIRSMHNLPPLPNDTETKQEDTKSLTSLESKDYWPVPRSFYSHAGPRIVLFMRLEGDSLQLRAKRSPLDEFERLLFCRVEVHRRNVYGQRVELIASGVFNGTDG